MKANSDRQFIYTAVSAAFGLGSVARFPALFMQHGGMFVLAYAAVLVFVGCPLLAAEFALGKRSACALPLKSICPLGGAVGGLSALNCAALCSLYGVITALSVMRACTFYASEKYGLPEHIPQATPFLCVIAFIALSYFLARPAAARAALARAAVLFQAAMIGALALFGAATPGAFGRIAATFARVGSAPGEVWTAALGQALLSLSAAAGVMPALALEMPRRLPPLGAAAVIACANFAGGALAVLAVGGLPGGTAALSDGAFRTALALYPAAIRSAFGGGAGAFGTIFFASLSLTAFASALSLARPVYVWAAGARVSARTAAMAVCAGMAVCALPFALGAPCAAADEFCCNVVAPVAAAGEVACFAFYALTMRRRRGKIRIWKILNS